MSSSQCTRRRTLIGKQRYYGLREELAAAHRIAENLSRTLPAGVPTQGRRRWMFWKRDL